MKKRILLAIGAGLFGFAVAAYAQSTPVPQVSIIGPNDLIQVVPNGVGSAQSLYAKPAQITSQMGYVKASPLTAFSYTFGNSQSILVLTHSSTIAQGTVTLAAAPSDGALECVFAQNIVTTLNSVANTGQTIDNAVTTIGAAAKVCYLYSLSTNTWDRS